MSRLNELIAELCPDGVEYKKIGSFANCYPGATPKTTVSEYWENGSIPWMSSGEVNLGEVWNTEKKITQLGFENASTKMVPPNTVVMALAGQGKTRGTVAMTRISLCTNQSLCAIVTDQTVLSDYLFHFLRSQYQQLRDVSSGDGTRGGLNLKMINAYKVPVPPLPVQQEIVRILDHFTELTAELQEQLIKEEQLLSLKQKYYLNKLVSSNIQYETRQLRDLMKVRMCKRIQKKQTVSNGSIPFYKNGTLGKKADTYIPIELYEEYKAQYPYPEKGAVMLSTAGTVGRAWIFDGKPAYFQDSNVVWLENDENFVSNEYLYWFCLSMPWKLPSRGTIKHLHNDMILDTYISVPPLHIQNDCISFLKAAINNFELMRDSLLSEISIRQKQYEYYRDKLLSFPEKG